MSLFNRSNAVADFIDEIDKTKLPAPVIVRGPIKKIVSIVVLLTITVQIQFFTRKIRKMCIIRTFRHTVVQNNITNIIGYFFNYTSTLVNIYLYLIYLTCNACESNN